MCQAGSARIFVTAGVIGHANLFEGGHGLPVLILAVWAGGMVGAYARWRLSGWVYERAGSAFPWGTLAVNVTGSFALGTLLPVFAAEASVRPARAFVIVGVIGAFTTFSTFAYEAYMLMEARQYARAATYVAASVGLGLAAIAAGLLLGSTFR